MKITTIRLNEEDSKKIQFLQTRLGIVSKTEIIRLALSKLAAAHIWGWEREPILDRKVEVQK